MAAAQAYRPTVSQYDGNGATRLRNTRTNSQQQQQQQQQPQQQQPHPHPHPQQSTAFTTTQGGSYAQPQSQQYSSGIGCSSNSGNGSTIAISTITNAPNLSRVRRTYIVPLSLYSIHFFSFGRKEVRYEAIYCTHKLTHKKSVKPGKNVLQICPINNRFKKNPIF